MLDNTPRGELILYRTANDAVRIDVLYEPESPFTTFIAEAPGLYTVRLEVCDAAGRGDVRLDRHVQTASAALQAQDLHLTPELQRFGERR